MPDNEEQIEYWNGNAGQIWTDAQERLDRLLAPLTAPAIAKANPRKDERILDVGCGCGATSIEMLERGADVCGVDISEPMLQRARQRAAMYSSAAFLQADASMHQFEPNHSMVFSRFGVMFFADPVSAFRNLHSALDPSGRLVFVCWQAPQKNAWMYVAGAAVQPHLPPPAQPVDPRAPGPFAFADPDYLRDLLAAAGFKDIELESVTADLHLADDLDDAIEFQGQVGPVARALAELDGERRTAALDAARDALRPHVTDRGLDLGASVWLTTARA